MLSKDKTTTSIALIYMYGLALIANGYDMDFSPTKEEKEGLPIILWWDGVSSRNDYIMSCEDKKCLISNDKSAFHRQKIMVYTFYASKFLSSGLPFPRQDGDLWALVHEESPKNRDWIFTFESTLELFNYTATFKRESHYPFPTHWLPNEEVLTSKEYLVSTEEKNRLRKDEGLAPVLFVHSDCSTASRRESYIKQLMKHVDVDSYGSCLHNKDFPDELKDLTGYDSFDSPSFLKFVARYKFSIAFENAICDDYMTEKLWRPLQVGSIPIVLGSSKVKDFLPSNKSAIVVTDFDSVKDLAEHIKYLDSNDEEYEEYVQFKHTGISNPNLTSELARMRPSSFENQNFMTAIFGFECFLCEKLHEAWNASKNDEPVPKSQATLSHFNCPLPTQTFDKNGKSVHDSLRDRAMKFYKRNAEIFRELYDKGENITAEKLYLKARDNGNESKDEL